MGPVDLTGLLRTAVRLSQPQWQGLNMEVRTDLPQELLMVRGDSNQLLQVCVQIINDALHVVHQHSSNTLTVAAVRHEGLAIVTFSDTSLADGPAESIPAADAGTEEDETLSGLGLNACQGILQQHQGRLSWQQVRHSGITIRVELPVIPATAEEKSNAAGVPVMWQPQPSS
jgi:two-component system NtrC family sensor kinase